jgi:hypothetical protein
LPELLRRTQGRAAEVTRAWEGQTVAVICTGPSLCKDDLDRVQSSGIRSIAVNDAYLVAPWADVLYAADDGWWKWHAQGLDKSWPWARFGKDQVRRALAEFRGQKVTIEHPTVYNAPDVLVLKNDGTEGLSERPDAIRTGQNSGYQAINIEALSRPKRILLLGMDMRFVNGKSHAHNGHPVNKQGESSYRKYAQNFRTIETPLKRLGIDVVNCAPGSLINNFRFSTVEKELSETLSSVCPS